MTNEMNKDDALTEIREEAKDDEYNEAKVCVAIGKSRKLISWDNLKVFLSVKILPMNFIVLMEHLKKNLLNVQIIILRKSERRRDKLVAYFN